MTEPLLAARGLVKTFGRVNALRGANFTVNPGEVVALIGDNGAGKSVLVKCLSGVHQPDAGSLSPRSSRRRRPGVKPAPVRHERPARPQWSEAQENLALIYREMGLRPAEIAGKLGVSEHLVTKILLAATARGRR